MDETEEAEEAEHAADYAAFKQWRRENAKTVKVRIANADRADLAPSHRRTLETLVFDELARRPKQLQTQALAAILEDAREIDQRSAQLRGAVTKLEGTLPRAEVWRVLQALADSYRAGEPLCVTDRAILLANEHLEREALAGALYETDSKASNTRKAAREKVSKTIAKARAMESAARISASVQIDARDRYPLLMTLARAAAERLGIRIEIRHGDRTARPVAVADPGTTIRTKATVAARQQRPLPPKSNG